MFATLKKFGPLHHDLSTMLWNVSVLLRLLALDIDCQNTRRTSFISYIVTSFIMGFYFYTYYFSSCWFIFWRGGDLLLKILLFSLTINSSIGITKLLYGYFNALELKKIGSEYLKCDAALTPNSRMFINMNATLRIVKRRAIIFWVTIVGNGFIYVMTPLVRPGRHLPEDDQALYGLEPMFESPNYEIAYIAMFSSAFFTVYAPANITGLIIIMVGYSEAQMLALAQELYHLWEDAQSHYNNLEINNDTSGCSENTVRRKFECTRNKKTRIVNDYIRNRLVSIIKSHAVNVNLVKKVESVFRSAIAIEFGLLSGGLIADLLGGLENTYIQLPFAFVQVSMDCFTGQRLINANKAFEDAVYSCQWEYFDVNNRKLVLMLLQNSQKTMRLSAGGVAILSYSALMSIIRSIYSAYTALRSTMK